MTPVLVFLATFGSVALVSYAVLDTVFSEDRAVSRRLKGLSEYEVAQVKEAQPLLKTFGERVVVPFFMTLGRGVRILWPAQYSATLATRIDKAGRPHGIDVDRLLIAKAVLGAGTFGMVWVFALFGGWRFINAVFFAVTVPFFAFMLPDVWLSGRMRSRQEEIVRQLPDLLDMLTISVEAGLGFDAALAKVVKTSRGALAEEFGVVLQKVQTGMARQDALKEFAERIDTPQIHSFIASLVQADIFGVSVATVLRTQSAEMRLVRKQLAEEKAQKAPVKMVIPLIACILPATMIVVLGPALIRIASLFGY